MKKMFLGLATCLLFSTFAFAGGDQNQNRHEGDQGQGYIHQEQVAKAGKKPPKAFELTPEQIIALQTIYQDEQLARDFYAEYSACFPDENTFANIQLSEQTHVDAVKNLLDKYLILIPDENDVIPECTSLCEALIVGKDIEILDIADLTAALGLDMPRDVERVLSHLIAASTNHLDAFMNALERESCDIDSL